MYRSPFPVIDLPATGANIRRLREAKGLSIRDLQRFFGFEEPQAIYKWQRGQSLPTVDNLYALSALLGVPMNDILVAANPPQSNICSKRSLPLITFFRFLGRRHGETSKLLRPFIWCLRPVWCPMGCRGCVPIITGRGRFVMELLV